MNAKKALALAAFVLILTCLSQIGLASGVGGDSRLMSSVAYDPATGRYFVAYYAEDANYMGSIRGQLLDINGQPIGAEVTLSDESAFVWATRPRVAYSPGAGQFMAVWGDARSYYTGGGMDIYGQAVSADGVPIGPGAEPGVANFPVSTAGYDQVEPDIAAVTPGSDFMVVWEDWRLSDYSDIYGQPINAEGVCLTATTATNIPVCTADENQYRPRIAANTVSGDVYSVWADQRTSAPSGIYGQVLDGLGTPLYSDPSVNQEVFAGMLNPDVPDVDYLAATNQYLVAFTGVPAGGDETNLYSQLANAEGGVVSATFATVSDAPYAQYEPEVAADPANSRYGVVWNDYRNYGSGSIYGQVMSSAGQPILTPPDQNSEILSGSFYKPAVAHGGSYLVTFHYMADAYGEGNQVGWVHIGDDLVGPGPDYFLIGHWPLDEGQGDVAHDLSVNQLDGSILGAEWAEGLNGEAGKALFFDGLDRMEVPYTDTLNTAGPFTVSAWVNPQENQAGDLRYLVARSKDVDNFSFALIQDGANLLFRVSSDGIFGPDANDAEVIAYDAFASNAWTHVAGVLQNGLLELYVNGALVAGPVYFPFGPFAGTSPLTVGSGSGGFVGRIADVRYYSTALSEEDIRSLAGLTSLIHGTLMGLAGPLALNVVNARGLETGFSVTALSDATGWYTMYVKPDCYDVSAPAPYDSGFLSPPPARLFALPAASGGSRVDFAYTPGGFSVQGTVQALGVPYGNLALTFEGEDGFSQTTFSDALGAYTFTGLPPGFGVIVAFPYGTPMAATGLRVEVNGDLVGVDIELPLAARVQGIVVGPDNQPVADAAVVYQNDGQRVSLAAMTDASGHFTIEHVPPGIGYVQANPWEGSYLCNSQRVPVNVTEGQDTIAGVVKLSAGALVRGPAVWAGGDPAQCMYVQALGDNFTAASGTSGSGWWEMVLPEGTHRIMLETNDGAAGYSACPLSVTVTEQDVTGQAEVQALTLTVQSLETGGGIAVSVPANQDWAPPGVGNLIAMALPAGSFPLPVSIEDLYQLEDAHAAYLPAEGGAASITPVCPGMWDMYLVWQDESDDSLVTLTVLDKANGLIVEAGYNAQVSLMLPSDYSPGVSGVVVDENNNPVVGATVLITGASGVFAGFAQTDAAGAYTLYNVPAPVGGEMFTAQGGRVGYTSLLSVGFLVASGVPAAVGNLTLFSDSYLSLTLIQRYGTATNADSYSPAEGQTLCHTEYDAWIGRASGPDATAVEPAVAWTPGKPMIRVYGLHQYLDGEGFHEDSIDPSFVSNPNTAAAFYEWYTIPTLGPDTTELGVFGYDSVATAGSVPMALSRTVQGLPSAAAYNLQVTLSVTVLEAGAEQLQMSLVGPATPIADMAFDPEEVGIIEAGGNALVESVNGAAATRVIDNPQDGMVYEYTRTLTVTPKNNSGVVDVKPVAKAMLVFNEGQAASQVNGAHLLVDEPAWVGQLEIVPQNDAQWLPAEIRKSSRYEAVLRYHIAEQGAARPQMAALSPAANSKDAPVNGPVTIRFTKTMGPGSLEFFMADHWGNVVSSTKRGLAGGVFSWTESVVPDDTVTFTPDQALSPATGYTVVYRARDAAGYSMLINVDSNRFSFTTEPSGVPEAVAPSVLSVFPADGSSGLPVTAPRVSDPVYITAVFSEAVTFDSVNGRAALYRLDGPGGNVVLQQTCDIRLTGNRVSLLPRLPLVPGTWHRVRMIAGIADAAGNIMPADYTWEFETGAVPGDNPSISFPMDGQSSFDPMVPALIFYPDRELAPSTLNNRNITVTGPGGTNLSSDFEFQYVMPSGGVVMMPTAEKQYSVLSLGETYTVTFLDGVTDLNGLSLAAAPQSFTFETTAMWGNSRPQIMRVLQSVLPVYPRIQPEPGGSFVDIQLKAYDRDLPFDSLNASADHGEVQLPMVLWPETGWFVHRTPDGTMDHILDSGVSPMFFTVQDSVGELALYEHDTRVWVQGPVLKAPADGQVEPFPPTLTWEPLAGAAAYLVTVTDGPASTSSMASFLVADDGSGADLSLTLPEDLAYPAGIWWQVMALAENLSDSWGAWGQVLSEKREVLRDVSGPYLSATNPQDGSTDASGGTVIEVVLGDDDTGVDFASVVITVDETPHGADELVIDATDPFALVASYFPEAPFAPGQFVNVDVYCTDRSGNPIAGPTAFSFTVRNTPVLAVPGTYPTINDALAVAGSGDTITVGPGLYNEKLEILARHSGVSIQGEDPETVILSGDGQDATVLLYGAHDVIISGLTIRDGGAAGVLISSHPDGTTENTLYGNIITGNLGDGVQVAATGVNYIHNNLIFLNGVTGFYAYDPNTQVPGEPQPQLLFNTIADNEYDGVHGTYADIYAYYNIISQNGRYGIFGDPTTLTANRNLVWGNIDGDYVGVAAGPDDVNDDPLFVDPFADQYRPAGGSPAIDVLPPAPAAGEPAYLADDIRFELRPQATGFDMGCYEVKADPDPPVASIPATNFVVMAGKPFNLTYTSTDERGRPLVFSLMGDSPQGLTFTQPTQDESPAILFWLPGAEQVGQYSMTPRVTADAAVSDGAPITLTVVPELLVDPLQATGLVVGATSIHMDCMVSGGTPPYQVELTRGDGTVAELQGLDGGWTDGPFQFVPLDELPAADNPVFIRVTDSSRVPVGPDATEPFTLISRGFGVQAVSEALVATFPALTPGVPHTLTVQDTGTVLDGMTIYLPAAALADTITITVSLVGADAPYLAERESPMVHLTPDGYVFGAPVTVDLPYTGAASIFDALALTFNTFTSLWETRSVVNVDPQNMLVGFETGSFSLYTTATESYFVDTLHAGDTVEDYRIFTVGAHPGQSYSMTELLGTPENLGPYDDTEWRLFAFDASLWPTQDANQYYVEGDAAGFAERFPMGAGQAYWLISRQGGVVGIPGLGVDHEADFYFTLLPGWNMLGNPYDLNVDFDWTESSADGYDFYNVQDPDPNNPLYGELLYDYDPVNAQPGQNGYVQVTVMNSMAGYFLYNPNDFPITYRIPTGALIAEAAGEKNVYLARLSRAFAKMSSLAWADGIVRTPPAPPGANGANAGSSAEAIGTAPGKASGGGTCFIGALSDARSSAPSALALMALFAGLLAVAVKRLR